MAAANQMYRFILLLPALTAQPVFPLFLLLTAYPDATP